MIHEELEWCDVCEDCAQYKALGNDKYLCVLEGGRCNGYFAYKKLKAENAELKSSLTHANEELKTRIRRVEKAVYVAARDEIEATYNVETMDKREYAEQIEAYMFDLFCRADKELAEEKKDANRI